MGKIFTDEHGRDWRINFTTGVLIELCEKFNVELDHLLNFQSIIARINPESPTYDPEAKLNLKLSDLLTAVPLLFNAQLKERGIDAKEFVDGFALTDLVKLGGVLIEALTDAFPEMKETLHDAADPLGLGKSETSTNLPPEPESVLTMDSPRGS